MRSPLFLIIFLLTLANAHAAVFEQGTQLATLNASWNFTSTLEMGDLTVHGTGIVINGTDNISLTPLSNINISIVNWTSGDDHLFRMIDSNQMVYVNIAVSGTNRAIIYDGVGYLISFNALDREVNWTYIVQPAAPSSVPSGFSAHGSKGSGDPYIRPEVAKPAATPPAAAAPPPPSQVTDGKKGKDKYDGGKGAAGDGRVGGAEGALEGLGTGAEEQQGVSVFRRIVGKTTWYIVIIATITASVVLAAWRRKKEERHHR